MNLLAIAFILISTISYQFLRRRRRPGANLPPGPYPFPIIGNILQLGKSPHESLAELSKTYGPLMSLQLGRIFTVVASSPHTAKQILQKHDQAFSSRIIPAAVRASDHHTGSLVLLPVGDEWRKTRKICREQLFSNHRLDASQELRQEKLSELVDYLRHCCGGGRSVDVGAAVFTTTVNQMAATLFSQRVVELDSSEAQEFKKTMELVTNVIAAPNLGDYFPILEPLDLQGLQRKSKIYFDKIFAMIGEIVEERLRLREEGSAKKSDVLETLLDTRNEYNFTVNFIKHMMLELLLGGSDTTACTLEWAMAELLLHPEKMEKAKDEVRNVIGQKKQVQESDISKLPYLQAVTKEVLRLHPTAPLLVARKSDCEVQLDGYFIPKNTQILVNVWAYSRDPDFWPNPESFHPERFLGQKVDYQGHHFEFIPFGSGRRMCPGLPLADRVMPVVLGTLLSNFDWKLEPEAPKLDMTSEFGFVLRKADPLVAIPIAP